MYGPRLSLALVFSFLVSFLAPPLSSPVPHLPVLGDGDTVVIATGNVYVNLIHKTCCQLKVPYENGGVKISTAYL